jgi:hypothetical protein
MDTLSKNGRIDLPAAVDLIKEDFDLLGRVMVHGTSYLQLAEELSELDGMARIFKLTSLIDSPDKQVAKLAITLKEDIANGHV